MNSLESVSVAFLMCACLSSFAIAQRPQAGVNYLSRWHEYRTPESILKRDFTRFRKDGLSLISIGLYWYRIEGSRRGDYFGKDDREFYGDPFLAEVKRVIETAHRCGLKVLVSFHTLWGDDSTWCTPKYVVDLVSGKRIGLAVARSEDMKQAFLDAATHAVKFLKGTPGIWGWAILNEPWYWPHRLDPPHDQIDQKAMFINLVERLSAVVKRLDGRPITIRFVSLHSWQDTAGTYGSKNIFIDDWGWDARLLNALDFVSFNAYRPAEPQLVEPWLKALSENVRGCRQRGKRVWVTEFGVDTDDDGLQEREFDETLKVFRTLPIDGWSPWFWLSDQTERKDEFGFPGKGFNVCADAAGRVRPAYDRLVASVRQSTIH